VTLIAIFIVLIFLYSLASGRLEQTVLTAPILFTSAGVVVMNCMSGVRNDLGGLDSFLHVAEIGLVLLLFTDASRTDLQLLKSIRKLPTRLLSTGMLLTIFLGGLAAKLVFPKLTIWEAGILAAILAPTDAGLGQVIVNCPRVPMRIRQALNVEAGLNDGLSVPFLLFFIALTGAATSDHAATLAGFIWEQLGYGMLLGLGIGLAGGWLLGLAHSRNWMAKSFEQLALVALPLCCALVSQAIGASMFIAAFVAGLAVQVGYKEAGQQCLEFTEEWGQLLNLAVFFLFGDLVGREWHSFDLASVLYAVLSLTVVRMLPVAIALIGTKLSGSTVLFMGWFGPRGLASIVLGLVYFEHGAHDPGGPMIRVAVMMTVLLSIFAHGLSALPGIRQYEKRLGTLAANAPEMDGAILAGGKA